ncbi:MAG TPA: hypothetical protein VEJ20_02470 [Candidatus Eremiobacteraceae bacterium]|nr:hypothetical protein [Candidatus Eremiobacteraceae bacterium]
MLFIVAMGALGGACCGAAILTGPLLLSGQPAGWVGDVEGGALFGGFFGLIAFPICYYVFLRSVPIRIALPTTIVSTVIVGWCGLPLFNLPNLPNGPAWFYLVLYGPGFVGLLLSSIALRLFRGRKPRAG